jgi:hypothetical protein
MMAGMVRGVDDEVIDQSKLETSGFSICEVSKIDPFRPN